jgi:hypothetical protein
MVESPFKSQPSRRTASSGANHLYVVVEPGAAESTLLIWTLLVREFTVVCI